LSALPILAAAGTAFPARRPQMLREYPAQIIPLAGKADAGTSPLGD